MYLVASCARIQGAKGRFDAYLMLKNGYFGARNAVFSQLLLALHKQVALGVFKQARKDESRM